MCLVQAKAVSIEGCDYRGLRHPTAIYNGLYTHDSTHEGWPVLKNARGRYCYRYTPADMWLIDDRFETDDSTCNANIVAKEGLLPVGAHTWQVAADGKWVDGTLTVGLLVRPPLPSPAACTSLPSAHRCPAGAERALPPRPRQSLERENGLEGL